MVQAGRSRADLPALVSDLQAGCTPSERALLAQIGPCLDWLEALDGFDQSEIRAVLRQIIHGQRLDLQRFGAAGPGNIVALSTAAELEEYTYLVAGCVGEFWTRCCAHSLPRYSPLHLEPLLEMGRDFGQGLQLVNILRDLPADLQQGRCYLPETELAAVGASSSQLPAQLAAIKPVFLHWLERGRQFLTQGNRYLNAVSSRRARLACWLPCSIGLQTLDLLGRQPPWEAAGRLKVPRSSVYRTLLAGVLPVLTCRPLHQKAVPC
jgi:farnesyl-diphosphate farnesyltransferase